MGFGAGGLVLLLQLLLGGGAVVNLLLVAVAVARWRRASARMAGRRFALRTLAFGGGCALLGVAIATLADHLPMGDPATDKRSAIVMICGIALVLVAPGVGALAATLRRGGG